MNFELHWKNPIIDFARCHFQSCCPPCLLGCWYWHFRPLVPTPLLKDRGGGGGGGGGGGYPPWRRVEAATQLSIANIYAQT